MNRKKREPQIMPYIHNQINASEIIEKHHQFLIFVCMRNHRKLDKYVAGLLKAQINVDRQYLIRMSVGKSFRDDYELVEATDLLAVIKRNEKKYKKSENKPKIEMILTDNEMYFSQYSPKIANPFNIKPDLEQKLIEAYLTNQDKITVGFQSKFKMQKLSLGAGLYLSDTSETTKYKISYEDVKPTTLALMYAIYYSSQNTYKKLLKYLNI